jgi:hypothetical protein
MFGGVGLPGGRFGGTAGEGSVAACAAIRGAGAPIRGEASGRGGLKPHRSMAETAMGTPRGLAAGGVMSRERLTQGPWSLCGRAQGRREAPGLAARSAAETRAHARCPPKGGKRPPAEGLAGATGVGAGGRRGARVRGAARTSRGLNRGRRRANEAAL